MLEEISWGQRIFGFETPELLQRYNLQKETNIHNLLVGPVDTTTRTVIEYAVSAVLFFYGVLYPLTLKRAGSPLSGSTYLWPYFLTAAVLELAPFSFNERKSPSCCLGPR